MLLTFSWRLRPSLLILQLSTSEAVSPHEPRARAMATGATLGIRPACRACGPVTSITKDLTAAHDFIALIENVFSYVITVSYCFHGYAG